MDSSLRELERAALSGSKEDVDRYEAALQRSGLLQLWVVGFNHAYHKCQAVEPVKRGQILASGFTSNGVTHVRPMPPDWDDISICGIALQDLEVDQQGLYQSTFRNYGYDGKSLVGATSREDAIKRAVDAWRKLPIWNNTNSWFSDSLDEEYVVDAIPFEPKLGWMFDIKYADALTRQPGESSKNPFNFKYKYKLFNVGEKITPRIYGELMEEKRNPRDGTCPGCGKIICYLLNGDKIWEHSKPKRSSSGIEFPRCEGNGQVALDPYTPVNFDKEWQAKPLYEIRMILSPEAATMRKQGSNRITG